MINKYDTRIQNPIAVSSRRLLQCIDKNSFFKES